MDESTRQATRLWTLAQPRVSAFITSVVRDFGDRDDVLQDIAVAVVESFDAYDTNKPFIAWAMGVARNQVGLYLRRRKQRHVTFGQSTVRHLEAAFSSLPDKESHQLDHLRDCLKELDARGRRLCELRYQQDMKPAAISSSLGLSGTSVRKALQRIREQLRLCVERKSTAEGL